MANSRYSQQLINQLDPAGVKILPTLPHHLRAIYLFEAAMWTTKILMEASPGLPGTGAGVVPPENRELLSRTVSDAATLLYQMHNNPLTAPQKRAGTRPQL